MMRKTYSFFTVFITLTLYAFTLNAQEYINPFQAISWKTLKKSKFSIQYPVTWELNDKGLMNSKFFLFSPLQSTEDTFRDNVCLITQDVSNMNMNLDQYTELTEKQVKTLITNSNIITSERVSSAKSDFHKIVYSGDVGIYHLIFHQHYWIIGNKAYVLTLSYEQSSAEKFQEIGEQIMNSFVIKSK